MSATLIYNDAVPHLILAAIDISVGDMDSLWTPSIA